MWPAAMAVYLHCLDSNCLDHVGRIPSEGRISSEILPNLHDKNDLKTLAVDKMDIEKTADLKCISRLLVEK